jgi:hypothetical protein
MYVPDFFSAEYNTHPIFDSEEVRVIGTKNEEDITVVKKGSGIKKKISDASYNVFKKHGFVKEEEQLDEISPELKSSYVSGAKKQIKQSIPFTKKSDEYRDIAKNFIAKRQKGIAKASKVEEAVRIGGIGSGNSSRRSYGPSSHGMGSAEGDTLENTPFHAKTEKDKRIKAALSDIGNKMKEKYPKLREAKDSQEYDYEGDMAKSDLRSIIHNAQTLHDMIEDNTNLAEWCQSKITLAEDYISTVTNYMRSEMNEEVKKNEYHISGKHKFPTKDEHAVTVKHTESGREHVHSGKGKYLSKLIKSRYNINHHFEDVEYQDVEQLDEKKKLPGLWANIHAKRKRGEAPAKPGDEDYPKTLNIEGTQDDPKADQMTTDDNKFPKKSRKASIVRAAAKKMPPEDQFQAKPVLDSQVAQQTNK